MSQVRNIVASKKIKCRMWSFHRTLCTALSGCASVVLQHQEGHMNIDKVTSSNFCWASSYGMNGVISQPVFDLHMTGEDSGGTVSTHPPFNRDGGKPLIFAETGHLCAGAWVLPLIFLKSVCAPH